jgi:hypothetical protein
VRGLKYNARCTLELLPGRRPWSATIIDSAIAPHVAAWSMSLEKSGKVGKMRYPLGQLPPGE